MAIDAISNANIYFMNALPMAVTNFGGDIQVCTVDSAYTQPIGLTFNDLALVEINGLAQPQLYPNWGASRPTTNVFFNTMQASANNMAVGIATQKVKTVATSIAMTKQRLDAMLLAGTYSEEQVAKINQLIEKLSEQEQAIVTLGEEAADQTPGEVNAKAIEIENEVREIINEITSIGRPEATENADETENAESQE